MRETASVSHRRPALINGIVRKALALSLSLALVASLSLLSGRSEAATKELKIGSLVNVRSPEGVEVRGGSTSLRRCTMSRAAGPSAGRSIR